MRIDHPDGLFDPAKYFAMLQELHRRRSTSSPRRSCRGASGCRAAGPCTARPATTSSTRSTASSSSRPTRGGCARIYAKLTGREQSFDDLLYETKRLIMDTSMASELTVLAHMLDRIGESNRRSRDFTLNSLRDALAEVVACFPIYRTYVDEHGWAPDDRAALERAIVRARRRNPAMEATDLRLLPRGAAAARSRRRASPRSTSGATAIRRPTRRSRPSACASR